MEAKTLTRPSLTPLQNPNNKSSPSIIFLKRPSNFSTRRFHRSLLLSCSRNFTARIQSRRSKSYCINPSQELNYEKNEALDEEENEDDEEEEETRVEIKGEGLANQSIWNQIKEIVMFTAPATGLWICGPLLSLIDTAIIGQRSSVELAALGN